jgi:hypothetical protein
LGWVKRSRIGGIHRRIYFQEKLCIRMVLRRACRAAAMLIAQAMTIATPQIQRGKISSADSMMIGVSTAGRALVMVNARLK